MGKKINLVTFCALCSFPNKADIEIKTFLEIILHRGIRALNLGWNLRASYWQCSWCLQWGRCLTLAVTALQLTKLLNASQAPRPQNKWLVFQELWLCLLLGCAESLFEGITVGRTGQFLQLLGLMLPCLSVLILNGNAASTELLRALAQFISENCFEILWSGHPIEVEKYCS